MPVLRRSRAALLTATSWSTCSTVPRTFADFARGSHPHGTDSGQEYKKFVRQPDSGTALLSSSLSSSSTSGSPFMGGSAAETSPQVPSESIFDIGVDAKFYFTYSSNPANFLYTRPSKSCSPNPDLTASAPAEQNKKSSSKRMSIKCGRASSFSFDAEVPPLTPEEMERWKLDRILLSSGILFWNKNTRREYLLPPTAEVTYLGDQMRKVDQVYRQKGYFTPSEVAEVFVPITPTFYVETRHILRLLPPHLLAHIENSVGKMSIVGSLLARYPMIFTLRRPKFHRAAVKLNTDMWFIREHPGFKKGDRLLYMHNADYHTTLGGVVAKQLPTGGASPTAEAVDSPVSTSASFSPIDIRIFEILIRHLPRISAADVEAGTGQVLDRYHPLRLVEWINTFTKEEVATLNKVHEAHVVHLMSRYVNVFQLITLSGEDLNLFVDREVLLNQRLSGKAETAVADVVGDVVSSDRSAALSAEGELWMDLPYSDEGSSADSSLSTPQSIEEVARRETVFRQAMIDDLVGMDEILSNEDGASGNAAEKAVHNGNTAALEESEEDSIIHDGRGHALNSDSADFVTATPGGSVRMTQRESNGEDELSFGVPLEDLYVRRIPPHVAPRSLSNLNQVTSPDPALVELVAAFLSPPPSMQMNTNNYFTACAMRHSGSLPAKRVWRWVLVATIYAALTSEQQSHVRKRYRGFANFLRYHGEIFELSEDFQYVIAHDPSGTLAPFVPTQTQFRFEPRVILPENFDDDSSSSAALVGEAERQKYESILGRSQIPTTRNQLMLLDSHNPMLLIDVLHEEVAALLPPHPVTKHQLMHRLPPIMRAALGVSKINFSASATMTSWKERGITMVQRKSEKNAVGPTKPTLMSVEDAISEVLQTDLPPNGVTVKALFRLHLSTSAADTLLHHYKTSIQALRAYPQYFELVDDSAASGDTLVRFVR